ncbi:MAG: SDR family NAD(P)-dependent oxidoreductase, partial [Clostridia bacterium]|nr:SDR family NAD(P)-dependent oxidoreductase [Clostridia bacterium]
MKILVTGGTGYIGSNTVVLLLKAGYEVVIVDNLYNSQATVVDKIKNVTGKDVAFYELDILDREGMSRVFDEHK